MSIFTTLLKTFSTQSRTRKSADDQIKGSYSEKTPREWEVKEDEKGNVSEQIGNTALFIRGNPETGYFILLGEYKVTRKIEHLWQAITIAEQTDWETIMNIQAVMIEAAFAIEKGIKLTKEVTKLKEATLDTHAG